MSDKRKSINGPIPSDIDIIISKKTVFKYTDGTGGETQYRFTIYLAHRCPGLRSRFTYKTESKALNAAKRMVKKIRMAR